MDWKTISADELVKGLGECSDECKAKAKEFLNTPTADEKAAAEKAEQEAAAKKEADDKAAAEKAEAEKKEAVDAAVEEQKKADKEECDKACEAAAKDAIANFKKVIALADDCKAKFGVQNLDGIATEKDLATKICTCDAAPTFLKNVKPEDAVTALRGYLAGAGSKTMVSDSVKHADAVSFADFIK